MLSPCLIECHSDRRRYPEAYPTLSPLPWPQYPLSYSDTPPLLRVQGRIDTPILTSRPTRVLEVVQRPEDNIGDPIQGISKRQDWEATDIEGYSVDAEKMRKESNVTGDRIDGSKIRSIPCRVSAGTGGQEPHAGTSKNQTGDTPFLLCLDILSPALILPHSSESKEE